jgi:hypothetical protein
MQVRPAISGLVNLSDIELKFEEANGAHKIVTTKKTERGVVVAAVVTVVEVEAEDREEASLDGRKELRSRASLWDCSTTAPSRQFAVRALTCGRGLRPIHFRDNRHDRRIVHSKFNAH